MPVTGPSEPTDPAAVDAVTVTVTLDGELTQRDEVRLGVQYNTDTPIRQPHPARYDGGASCPFCGRGPGTCHHRSGGPA